MAAIKPEEVGGSKPSIPPPLPPLPLAVPSMLKSFIQVDRPSICLAVSCLLLAGSRADAVRGVCGRAVLLLSLVRNFGKIKYWKKRLQRKIFSDLLSQSVFAAAGSSKMGEEEKDMREYANTAGIGICA